MATPPENVSMALYCDFENVALGVRDAKYEKFDISKVLERLLLKGSIVVKKAYCDWDRYREFKAPMHEASFELIEIPHVRQSGKNSADIRMVVDALDLCYTKGHVDTFVIISGDSDFSPLVSKLRENNKTVIGVGVKGSTSDLLTANCDEFIFYDDLVREPRRRQSRTSTAAGNGAGRAQAAPPVAARVEASKSELASKSEAPARPAVAARVEPPAADAEAGVAAASAAGDGPKKRPSRRRKPGADAPAPNGSDTQTATEVAALMPVAEPVSAAVSAAATSATTDTVSNALAEPLAAPGSDERRRQDAIDLVVETVEALITERGADDKIWGSMVKQTLKRRRPGFAEGYYGYRSFNELLEDARDRGLLALAHDEKSGGYVIGLV
jgi:uncharacterized protein (TIGR00288 family)